MSRPCSSSSDGCWDGCVTGHYSLAEVNAAIGELLTHLNEERPIRRLGVTRRQLLEQIDRPTLKSLPAEPYEFSEWRSCRVGIDYHVEVAAHYYSVPYRFARAEVDARLTARTVEIFLKGERIARWRLGSRDHYLCALRQGVPRFRHRKPVEVPPRCYHLPKCFIRR